MFEWGKEGGKVSLSGGFLWKREGLKKGLVFEA
jgi:hypothetical protein